jgi:hypothetical protein
LPNLKYRRRVFPNSVDGILSNKNRLSAIGRSVSGGKDLIKVTFKRPHSLSLSPHNVYRLDRGRTRGRGRKWRNFVLYGELNAVLVCMRIHIHSDISN